MEKVSAENTTVDVAFEWTCPNCEKTHEEKFYQGPYQAIADSPSDVHCKECNEFYEITFFNEN